MLSTAIIKSNEKTFQRIAFIARVVFQRANEGTFKLLLWHNVGPTPYYMLVCYLICHLLYVFCALQASLLGKIFQVLVTI